MERAFGRSVADAAAVVLLVRVPTDEHMLSLHRSATH